MDAPLCHYCMVMSIVVLVLGYFDHSRRAHTGLNATVARLTHRMSLMQQILSPCPQGMHTWVSENPGLVYAF